MGGDANPESTAIAAATEVTAEDSRILLFPMGKHLGRDGRGPYELRDVAHAHAVIAETRRRQGKTDIALDYDHQLARPVEPGEEGNAIASGWIKPANLVADAAGIWATDPQWTPGARAKLDAKEYRYISPHFGFLKVGGALTRIINAALVNRPNLEIAAVAAELPGEPENMKELLSIASALGLAATATAEDIVASIGGLKAAQAGLTATASALGVASDASAEAIATAAQDLKTRADAGVDITKFVPIEQYQPLVAQLAVINEERATAAIDGAIAVGKIAPSTRDYWRGRFLADETATAGYIASAPVMLKPGSQLDERQPGSKSTSLTAEELTACAATGMTHEDYLAAKNEGIA